MKSSEWISGGTANFTASAAASGASARFGMARDPIFLRPPVPPFRIGINPPDGEVGGRTLRTMPPRVDCASTVGCLGPHESPHISARPENISEPRLLPLIKRFTVMLAELPTFAGTFELL